MITKSALNKQKCSLNLWFARNARTAWMHILRSFSAEKKVSVLLPAYIGITEREGSGVFDPIRQISAEYKFYRVEYNLQIDLKHFEDIIKAGGIDIALVIHYFGLCRNKMEEIVRICRKYDVALVEDCAHAFQLGIKNHKLGGYGDCSFYSVHKFLATNSGGVIRQNSDKIKIAALPESKQADYEVLEQIIKTDVCEVAEIRRANFRMYQELVPDLPGIIKMYELKEEDVPQTYPILIKNGLREKLYFYLIEKGVPAIALYYRLIEEIGKDQFEISHEISEEILNLPVHQDITLDDIKTTCSAIASFFRLGVV